MKERKILALLFTGVLMGALDISIVGPAIPSIEETITIHPRDLGWIFSIYVLFNLVGISLFAKLSDIFGRQSIYILSISLFAIGSLVVATANDMTFLLVGRAIQGFGGSGIFPVASAVVGDIFPPEKRGRVLGLIGAVWGLAFILGPLIAGILLAFTEWHMLFLINIPIAIVLIYFSRKLLSPKPIESSREFDWKGVSLLGIVLASFTYGVNSIDQADFFGSITSVSVAPFILVSIALAFLLLQVEKRSSFPIVNPRLFQSRQIVIVGLIAIATGLFQSLFIFIPDYVVNSFGYTSSKASFMLLPFVTATAIGSPVFGRMLDKIGSRKVILLGLLMSLTGLLILGFMEMSLPPFFIAGVFIGLGMSVLAGSSLRYIMLNEVGIHERATTQGVVTIFISIGQITGAPSVGAIIAGQGGKTTGYQTSFLLLGIVFALMLLPAFLLRNRSQELIAIEAKKMESSTT